ncbi:MAG: dipeptide/oligopeptide/nickel ABC transporter ATP-binding protein [Thermodesulfobacteriota bacterium]
MVVPLGETPIICVANVCVPFGGAQNKTVTGHGLKNISFSLAPGSRVGLVGPSAAGKTTLGMVCAGLLPPKSGNVYHFNQDIYQKKISPFSSHHAMVQMVFQDPFSALNPRRTVRSWLRFCQRKTEIPLYKKDDKAMKHLEMVNLSKSLLDRFPGQLSGGECQRVAITASLLSEAKCLLLDEPTNMLDSIARKQVLDALKNINNHLKTSLLYITHDLASAGDICEKIIFLYNGSIIEEGTYDELHRSGTVLVRDFFNAYQP